jgi:serine/threonine protein kinase
MRSKKKHFGGKVIAAGGFGCVFSPALKCKQRDGTSSKTVSKLMLKRDALEEYNEIINIKRKIDDIPNFQDFFVLENINMCEVDSLNKEDLVLFEKKCKPLMKRGITQKNINKKLGEVLALNLPNGGLPIDDYFENHLSLKTARQINGGLIHLLKNGIVPMNKRNVFHSDIKDSNVLVDSVSHKHRLIDWGLSVIMGNENENSIPKKWRDRPLQYNLLFSIILINGQFIKKFDDFLNNNEVIWVGKFSQKICILLE